MRTKAAKTEKEITAAMAASKVLEIEMRDGTLHRMRVGNAIFTGNSYSTGMVVAVVVEHEEAKRIRVDATIDGFPPQVRYFEYATDASAFKDGLPEAARTVQTNDVAVLLDDDGTVVREAGAATTAPSTGDDIPF